MYCDECGMPKGVGKANAWKPGGAIVSRYEADLRGIFYDAGEYGNLFSRLSERIGYDVTRLVIEGKRKETKHYTRGVLANIRKSGAEPPSPEEFFRIMAANYRVPGFGKVRILDYRKGESIVLEIEDAYNVPMALGQVAGAFEGVLDRRGDVSWDGDARLGRATVKAREGEPELERRMESEVEAGEPLTEQGDRKYELCGSCYAPRELCREFSWDVEGARITERRSGRRFIFDNTRGITAVMRVLVEELGEDVEHTLTEISRDYAREYYLEFGEADVESEFARLSLWGWGLPANLREDGRRYELEVINPFYAPVMTGRIWGLMEALTGNALDLGEHGMSENGLLIGLSVS